VDRCVGVLQRDVRKLGVGIPTWLLQNSDYYHPVFATGQSVRPEGRTRTDYES